MIAGATDDGICILDFPHRKMIDSIFRRVSENLGARLAEGNHTHFITLQDQLKEYFTGQRTTFDLPLKFAGSPFQVEVWKALQHIPYAETRSYKAQSIILGNEKAIRAVARANGENCLAILVPCHRVIGENGSLT
ncbi:MAG: methylated-DNA--[protein]-cysteine S-methyltransferase, partial [Sphingobacteriales bacterium]